MKVLCYLGLHRWAVFEGWQNLHEGDSKGQWGVDSYQCINCWKVRRYER